ncbi:Phage long tail fiber [Salmonella phage Tennessee]
MAITKIILQQMVTMDQNSITASKYPKYTVVLSNSISSITAGELTTAIESSKASAAAAKTSETNAKQSELNAKGSENRAEISAASSQQSATQSASSATASANSAGAAKTSETNAKASELAAKTSETHAKASETAAKTSETHAKASETAAAASASAAKTSETNAKQSELNAKGSENRAEISAASSQQSATQSASSATASANSAGAAKTSETNAKASETAAKTSETHAKTSETNAASSASSASSSATAAENSARAAKTSETNAGNSAQAADASKTAAANSATAAKTSETNAKKSETAAKTSETNAKTSENKAKEYLDRASELVSPVTQYDWPVGTDNNSVYVKIAKLTDPGALSCHLTLMITNGGNYGSSYGNIDFVEISARGLNDARGVTSENITKFLSVRRLGSPNLAWDNQLRYGLVEGNGYFEVWCYQRAFIKETRVAVLAQTGRTELYIPKGFVSQDTQPSGFIESLAARIYDQVNKPSKADLGLENAMLVGAFGLGGNGLSYSSVQSNVDLINKLKANGGQYWRAARESGANVDISDHGSGFYSHCGDTHAAINVQYSTGIVRVLATTDRNLASGIVHANTLYGTANKPSKSDVGLGNVTNDAQVKKSGDVMSGDLDILKETPSIRLKSTQGNAHLWFMNNDGSERGVIWSPPNNGSLGEIHIRAKTTGGITGGDFIVHHDGRIEAKDAKIIHKISSRTAEFSNDDTNTAATNLLVSGKQHTPIMLVRDSDSNVSVGFKLNNMNAKLLGIDIDGDLAFGENPDHKQNSKLITQAKLDSGVTVGGKTTFSDLATFNAGMAGPINPEYIGGKAIDLNDLVIKFADKGSVKYYQCTSAGGGNAITNKPSGIGGNFLLRVESIRKVNDSDYTNLQTLVGTDTRQIYVRYCNNGTWSAWHEAVVSGMNQDVSVRSLSASGRLSGGELAVGGAGTLNGNLGVGGGATSKMPSSDKGIVIGHGSIVREGGEGRLILSSSGGTDRLLQLRPAGAMALDNQVEISCTSASAGDTKISFGQGAAIRCNSTGSPIISSKAGQTIYLRPNGDEASNGQVTLSSNGDVVVNGNLESTRDITCARLFSKGALQTESGGIELYHSTPFIDFHFNKATSDYTARIINDAANQLTFDCQSVRTLHDFTAYGLVRGCNRDAFVAWPVSDPSASHGQIRIAPKFQSRFNSVGSNASGAARMSMWFEEHVGYNHRGVVEVGGYGAPIQYWHFRSDGAIWGSAKGDVAWAGTSDLRYKDNVVDYDGLQSLENIKAMNLIKFTYKDDDRKRERRGVAAQQIMEIDPCYVKKSEGAYIDANGEQVNIEKLVLDTNPLLMDALCAIKVLSAQVGELKEENAELHANTASREEQVTALESEVSDLKKQIADLTLVVNSLLANKAQ